MDNPNSAEAVLPQILEVLKELLVHVRAEAQAKQAEAQAELAEARAELAEAQAELAEAQAKQAEAQAKAAEAPAKRKKKKAAPRKTPAPVAAEVFRDEDVERWLSGRTGDQCSSHDEARRLRWEAQRPAKRKRESAKPVPKKEYESAQEAKNFRMACETSGLQAALEKQWHLDEFRSKVAAVRACGGVGNFRLLVSALQGHLDNRMQVERFMTVLEEFIRERGHRHIARHLAESDAGSDAGLDAGSDTEVDSNL
jgi:chromosome segregation ATPase